MCRVGVPRRLIRDYCGSACDAANRVSAPCSCVCLHAVRDAAAVGSSQFVLLFSARDDGGPIAGLTYFTIVVNLIDYPKPVALSTYAASIDVAYKTAPGGGDIFVLPTPVSQNEWPASVSYKFLPIGGALDGTFQFHVLVSARPRRWRCSPGVLSCHPGDFARRSVAFVVDSRITLPLRSSSTRPSERGTRCRCITWYERHVHSKYHACVCSSCRVGRVWPQGLHTGVPTVLVDVALRVRTSWRLPDLSHQSLSPPPRCTCGCSACQTLNITTTSEPPESCYFSLTVRIVYTEVTTPNPSMKCFPGYSCPITIIPSKGAAATQFFIELIDSQGNITVLALTDRADPLVASGLGGRAVYTWSVPVTVALGTYTIRATSPVIGLDASSGVSEPFVMAQPYKFMTGLYGKCTMAIGTGVRAARTCTSPFAVWQEWVAVGGESGGREGVGGPARCGFVSMRRLFVSLV